MLQPVRGGTWAPSGHTPIQHAWDRHDRLSAVGALSLPPARCRIGLHCDLERGNVHGVEMVHFLRGLHRHLQRKLILVCDRYQVHRTAVRQLRDSGVSWLQVEWLPPYSPDLNPVEAIWNHTKCVDLADFIPNDLDELQTAVLQSIEAERSNPALKRSFFESAGLEI
jgi:transposase